LLRERRRGGQSFVVCPRVADVEPLARRLREAIPELEIVVAHGKMPAADLDAAMIDFAAGNHDVLLATNIIESGLDVPAANTMLVWRPDRFGLAQLHQLRGRVGRGRVRASCYFLLDPAAKLAPATMRRLKELESLDRLGSGFAISAGDLDLRGAGDLLGADQAGHVKPIGLELYQEMFARAMGLARGRTPPDDWRPVVQLELEALIPRSYVPADEIRIELYRRIARASRRDELESLEAEIEDRFGQRSQPVRNLLGIAGLRRRARRLGLGKIEAGERAIAVSFHDSVAAPPPRPPDAELRGARLIVARESSSDEARLAAVAALVDELAAAMS
jgi:transcription-repair coupling factor (superfamily II helicase)